MLKAAFSHKRRNFAQAPKNFPPIVNIAPSRHALHRCLTFPHAICQKRVLTSDGGPPAATVDPTGFWWPEAQEGGSSRQSGGSGVPQHIYFKMIATLR